MATACGEIGSPARIGKSNRLCACSCARISSGPRRARLFNRGPAVRVSRHRDGQRHLVAARSMPVEFTPPRFAAVIDKRTGTRALVLRSDLFGLSLSCLPYAGGCD